MRNAIRILVLVMSIGSGGLMSAQAQTVNVEAGNKAIIEAGFKAWADGTGSPFELLADDASWTIVGRSAASKVYHGREAFMREVIRPFNARMREPLTPAVRRIYADGDWVIAFFDAKGRAKDGTPYVNTYAWFMRMRDGKIVEASAFFDSIEFNELWARVPPGE